MVCIILTNNFTHTALVTTFTLGWRTTRFLSHKLTWFAALCATNDSNTHRVRLPASASQTVPVHKTTHQTSPTAMPCVPSSRYPASVWISFSRGTNLLHPLAQPHWLCQILWINQSACRSFVPKSTHLPVSVLESPSNVATYHNSWHLGGGGGQVFYGDHMVFRGDRGGISRQQQCIKGGI